METNIAYNPNPTIMMTTDELLTLFRSGAKKVDDYLPTYESLLAPENHDAATVQLRGMLQGLCDRPEELTRDDGRSILDHLMLLTGILKDTESLPLILRLLRSKEFGAAIPQNAWIQGEISRVLGELFKAGCLPEVTAMALDPEAPEALTSALVMSMVFRWFSGYERDSEFADAMRQLCEKMPSDKLNFELGMTIIVDAIAVGGDQLRPQITAFYQANSAIFQPQLPEKNLKNFFDLGRQRIKNMLRANYLGQYTTPQGELSRMLSYNPDAEEPQETPKALPPIVRDHPKVGRNEPCPCGSGKKFKNCCGK